MQNYQASKDLNTYIPFSFFSISSRGTVITSINSEKMVNFVKFLKLDSVLKHHVGYQDSYHKMLDRIANRADPDQTAS